MYRTLTDERDIMRFTHSKATSDAKEGGAFTWFDGSIEGQYTKLEPVRERERERERACAQARLQHAVLSQWRGARLSPPLSQGSRIECAWRFRTWTPQEYSTVVFELTPVDGGCRMRMTQTGIPKVDAHGNQHVDEAAINGWEQRVFLGIKRFMGFGMERDE